MKHYHGFDITLASDLTLPLPTAPPSAADIAIRLLEPIDVDSPPEHWDVHVRETEVEFLWEEAGRFIVRNGDTILIHPKRECSEGILVDSILGECLGTALIQRNVFAMHASAVSYQGNGIVLTGTGGLGKSTLAWVASQLGAIVLADEITGIEFSDAPSIIPGPPLLKVRDSVLRTICDPETFPKAFPNSEKRILQFPPPVGRTPLRYVLFLRPGDTLAIEPMTKRQVTFALLENTFAAHLSDAYETRFISRETEGALFAQCADLASRITPFSLTVPPTAPTPQEFLNVLETLN